MKSRHYLFIFLMSISLILSIFSCFGKKEKKVSLDSWLEEKSPGTYIVMDKLINLDPKNLFYKKSSAIIGLKNDSLIQVRIDYNKDQPDLGLSFEQIKTDFAAATNDINVAREIVEQLKAAGAERVSVGVMTPAIYFLPYGEPTAAFRNKHLQNILRVLEQRNDEERKSIWIEIMEDSFYHQQIHDIIPNGYWQRQDGLHDRNKIMSLDFEWTADIDQEALMKGWEINPGSDRAMKFIDIAYAQANVWANKNLPKPFYLDRNNRVEVSVDDQNPMAIEYAFPVLDQQPTDSIDIDRVLQGYVTGIYDSEKNTFTSIRKRDDN